MLGGQQYVNRVTFTIPRHVNVRAEWNHRLVRLTSSDAPNGDHSSIARPALQRLNTNQVVNDINAGNFTTNALNISMYPNTFLF